MSLMKDIKPSNLERIPSIPLSASIPAPLLRAITSVLEHHILLLPPLLPLLFISIIIKEAFIVVLTDACALGLAATEA
jgi:hypothetical protein